MTTDAKKLTTRLVSDEDGEYLYDPAGVRRWFAHGTQAPSWFTTAHPGGEAMAISDEPDGDGGGKAPAKRAPAKAAAVKQDDGDKQDADDK